MIRSLSACVLSCFFLLAAAGAHAADLRPMPNPDLSRLTKAQADDLRLRRTNFDKEIKAKASSATLAEAYASLGSAYARNGLFDAASVAMANAAQLVPEDARWPYLQGAIARALRQSDAARGFFERAFRLNPDYLPARVAVVGTQIQAGQLDAANKLLNDYVATHKNAGSVYALLGDIAVRQKRHAEAIAYFQQALRLDPAATALYTQLAASYEATGNAQAARDARAKAGTSAPKLNDYLLRLLMPSAPEGVTAGASTQSKDVASGATSQPPAGSADPVAQIMAQVLGNVGAGRYAEARQLLDQALKKYPNNPGFLATYARVDLAVGNQAQALAHANEAVRADANNAIAQLTLGLVLETRGDDTGAQAGYRKAIAVDAKLVEAHFRLGNLFMRLRQYPQASAEYRQLTALQPQQGEYWNQLVAAEAAAGKCTTAMADINAGLAKQARSGDLMELFVRVASTCRGVSKEVRQMALDHAVAMYKQNSHPRIAEAYALALAANGKWDDAVSTQGAAIYDVATRDSAADAALYRDFFQRFQAKQVPDQPWPAASPLFNPQRPTAAPAPAAAPAGTAKPK